VIDHIQLDFVDFVSRIRPSNRNNAELAAAADRMIDIYRFLVLLKPKYNNKNKKWKAPEGEKWLTDEFTGKLPSGSGNPAFHLNTFASIETALLSTSSFQ
jgi:hypothetical protein